MKRRGGRALSAAIIISAALIVEFSLILSRCDGKDIISERWQDSGITADESSTAHKTQTLKSSRSKQPEQGSGNAAILTIKNIYQLPELPTGCEVTALTAVMRFYGLEADKEELAYSFLPREDFEVSGRVKYGADPEKSFAGDPFSTGGYGAMSGVVEQTANAYFESCGSTLRASAVKDRDLSFFTARLKEGKPSLIWVTMDMKESYISDSWLTREGRQVYWQANEHCVVLAGIDEQAGVIWCADPLKDTEQLTAYDEELFAKRFYEMGAQGVIFE